MEHNIFEELVPSVSPLLKKHIRLGHANIGNHSVDLSTADHILYICITANTSAIWQHAAHITDQLTSPSC